MRFKGYKSGGKLLPSAKSKSPRQRDSLYQQPILLHPADTAMYTSERLITLGEVFFDLNSAALKEGFSSRLDSLITFLARHPTFKVYISGHTDNSGLESNNLRLSKARAGAVASYLKSKGISESRISFKGEGSTRPIASNETAVGRKQNRRVEIIVSEI